MNEEDVISHTQEYASEYLELIENQDMFLTWFLANKVVKLNRYIAYLEKRLRACSVDKTR